MKCCMFLKKVIGQDKDKVFNITQYLILESTVKIKTQY